MTELVFVYGTLKQGRGNHVVMGNDYKFIGKGETVNKYSLYANGIPFLVEGNTSKCKGELYEVSEETLKGPLDRLESHPTFYKREQIPVMVDGKEYTAWCYMYQGDVNERYLLEDGEF